MDLLQIIENTGNTYKKAALTSGGEFKGSCPWCGGDDRFSIQPEVDHYVCRQCKRAGDTIQFYRDYEKLSYEKARQKAGKQPKLRKKQFLKDKLCWQPRAIEMPPLTWQKKAEAVAFSAFKYLMSSQGKPHREYLHSRGLTIETIKTARIGWNQTPMVFDRAAWGLLPETGKDNQTKNIWIPKGFIIPQFENNQLIRIRVRQDQPINPDDKYILVSGSATGYFIYPKSDNPTNAIFIVEAELDGWLSWQSFGDLAQINAIGNTTTRPDQKAHNELKNKARLLSLDNDNAGRQETGWWEKQYAGTISCPVPVGKDPGEAFEKGFDLREWFIVLTKIKGLYREPAIRIKPQPVQDTVTAKPKRKVKQDEFSGKICIHNYACVHGKDRVCLVNKTPMGDIERCPKDKWWLHKHGVIAEVILGFGKKGHFM